MKQPEIQINNRKVGEDHPPLIIAEIGINHDGDFEKAIKMIDDAIDVGCECLKFQCHILLDEMIPNDVVPPNANNSIWDIIAHSLLSPNEEARIKRYVEQKGCLYLSTPFSRAAANRLEELDVSAFKIGSGECSNYPLLEHVSRYRKPIILSTGMNDFSSIDKAVAILRRFKVPFALLQCTSIYPTPPDKLNIGVLSSLRLRYPDAVVGLSDHSTQNFSAIASIALGGSIVEKHFTSNKDWSGPDNSMSIDPHQLQELIVATRVVKDSLGSEKMVFAEEKEVGKFAYATVVSIKSIESGEEITTGNAWVKRPGTGEITAEDFPNVLGKRATVSIPNNTQLQWSMLDG